MKKALYKKNICRILAGICTISMAFPSVSFAAEKGWRQFKGSWSYYQTESVKSTGWDKINGEWYYFDKNDGVMKTGWFKDSDGSWYFLSTKEGTENGKMLFGWQWIDGYCYYLGEKESGKMYASAVTPDGYKVNESGCWTDEEGRVQFVRNKGYTTKKETKESIKVSSRNSSGGSLGGSGNFKRKDKDIQKKPEENPEQKQDGLSDKKDTQNNKESGSKEENNPDMKNPPSSEDTKEQEESQNSKEDKIEGFITIADYKETNILFTRMDSGDNLATIQEKVYALFPTKEEKEKLYFLEQENQVLIVDLNNKLLGNDIAAEGNEINIGNKIYLSTEDNVLQEAGEEELAGANSHKLMLLSGTHTRNGLLAAEYTLGMPGNTYTGSIAVLDKTKEVAGIHFEARGARVGKGANGAMISLKSTGDDFDCSIDHNIFHFSDEDKETELYRGIGIYSFTGKLAVSENRFEGHNKKNGIGSSNIHGMIDCQERIGKGKKSKATSFISITKNEFTDIYSAGIILYASDRESVDIENNLFKGTGEEAIKLYPVCLEYPAEHAIVIRGNSISKYGLNKNTGYTDGGFGALGPVNTGEFGIHLSFYNGVQRGAIVNGEWTSSVAQLTEKLKMDNLISSKEENDRHEGVVDSKEVLIGQKELYIDTASAINKSGSILVRDKSLVIVKKDNGDVIYGQNPENITEEIRVRDLYITGEGTGVVSLPSTLHITGNLKVDLPNGFVKLQAKVDKDVEINSGTVKSSASFTVLTKEPIPKGAADKEYEVQISDLHNDEGMPVEDSELEISVLLGKNELSSSDFEYREGILRIHKEVFNILKSNEKLIIGVSSPAQNMSKVSSPLILVEISNLSDAKFTYSSKSFSHLDAENPVRVTVRDIRNNRGEKINPEDTKLAGNVEFYIFGQAQDKSLFTVDDATDTIVLSKELLNYLYATKYTASPDRNANFGMAQSYEIKINDASNHVYDISDRVSFEVTDRSGADFVFEKGMTYTQGEAPEEGITLSIRNVVNTRGESVSASSTELKDAEGNLNMNVEPFPVQRDDTEDSEIIVLRDSEGNYIREIFNPKYIIIDDEKDTITFTKEYLDKIQPGKDQFTENGIKTFVFKYMDTSAKVDVRSQKVALHIKLKEKALSKDTEITFKEGSYHIEGDEIIAADTTVTNNLIVAGFLKNIIKNNPRQQIIITREGKVLRRFDPLYQNDRIKIIAEDGISESIYTLNIQKKPGEKLYKDFDKKLIKEFSESFIMVNKEESISIRKFLGAITYAEGVHAKVLSPNQEGGEYEPVQDSTLTETMVLVLEKDGTKRRFEIRFADGVQYRALLIGNQDYGNPKINLAGPENDLRIMNNLFRRASFDGQGFETIQVKNDLKKEEFLAAVSETFAGATDEDISYLYYSGHGYYVKSNDTSYICTVDAMPENSEEQAAAESWVSVDELKEALDKIPGTKVLILDCCNAGGFIGKEFTDAVSGATPKKDIAQDSKDFVSEAKSIFTENTKRSNYLTDGEYKVLVASSSNEYSYEDKKRAIGKFTVEFVKGAEYHQNNALADKNKDREISLDEMYNYLMANVESISHIQVFPQKDGFRLIDKIEASELHSSVLFEIKNSAYSFESRTLSNGKIVGTIKGNLITIDENMSAGEFLENIERNHEGQSLSVTALDGTEYAQEEKLRKADAYLKVVAENGDTSKYPIVVEKFISDDKQKSIRIKGVVPKGITVSIDENASLYAIALEKPLHTMEFVNAIRSANADPMKSYKLFGKDGEEKAFDRKTYVASKDKLEVTSADGSLKQFYNITVNSENGEEIDGEYKIENNIIKSGTKQLTDKTKVSELLNWLKKNNFDLDQDRMSGIYPAGSRPPFGRKKMNNQTLAEGDRLIIRDFTGITKFIYTIELAQENPDNEEEIEGEDFASLVPDFGTALTLENNTIKSGTLTLNTSATVKEVLDACENKEEIAALTGTKGWGIYKGSAQIIGGVPNKAPKKDSETLGYGDRLILIDKSGSGNYKVYNLEMDDEGGDTGPIIIPPIIIEENGITINTESDIIIGTEDIFDKEEEEKEEIQSEQNVAKKLENEVSETLKAGSENEIAGTLKAEDTESLKADSNWEAVENESEQKKVQDIQITLENAAGKE